jgi:hypothetical protein
LATFAFFLFLFPKRGEFQFCHQSPYFKGGGKIQKENSDGKRGADQGRQKSIKASWNVIICLLCKLAYSSLVLYKQIMTRLEYEPCIAK